MDGNAISKTIAVGNIYQQQALTQQSTKAAPDSAAQKASADPPQKDSVSVSSSRVTMRNLDTARAIEQMHANLNQQARSVRETNESINRSVDQIDTMRNTLMNVSKNYPPYPVDSKERNEILMSYVSLRKELMRLMVPPPPPPVYEKVQHMWSSLFDESGQVAAAKIPELTPKSSDAAVRSAVDSLTSTSGELADFSDKVTQALVTP